MPTFQELYDVAHRPSGSLGEVPFAVLLHALSAFERTVTVDFERHVLKKTVVVEAGVPVDCRSNLVHETLGRYMVGTGRLTEEQMNECLRDAVVRGTPFGQTLLERKLVTAEDLFRVLQQNLAKKLLDLFTWHDAAFQIRPEAPEVSSPLKVRVPQLVVMGVTRFAPPTEVDAAVASLVGRVLCVAPDPPYSLEEIRLSEAQQRILGPLRQGCRLDQLASASGLPVPDLARIVYALVLLGVVAPLPEGTAAPEPRPVPVVAKPAPAAPPPPPPDAPRPAPDAAEHARVNDEIMRVYLSHRGQDAFDLLGLPEDAGAPQAAEAFLRFSERYWPDRFARDYAPLAEKARDIFLAGARAYAELADMESRTVLVSRRRARREDAKHRPPPDFTIKTDLLDPEVQFKKGVALLESGQCREAITQLQFASDCDPSNGVYRSELAHAWFRLSPGYAHNALAQLEEAMRIDPKCGLALLYSGEIQAATGRPELAEPLLRKAVKMMAPDRRPIAALRALSGRK